MKYKPALPEYNDNISKVHPLRELLILLTGLLIFIVLCYWILGLLVDYTVQHISPEMEQKWFNNSNMKELVKSSLTEDAVVESVDSALFTSLLDCAKIDYPLNLWRVTSPLVNAVAIPGGDILFFTGLENKLTTENAYAFVLAHEIAHFKNRDHLRGLGRGVVIAFILTSLTGNQSGLTNLLSPLSQLSQANHSQSRESNADSEALDILNCHYGHVGGATEFFDLIKKEKGNQSNIFDHHFSTHPDIQSRIDQINKLALQRNYSKQKTILKIP